MTDDYLASPSDFKAGSFFDSEKRMNDYAILFEPTRVDKQVPNTYQGKSKPRDEAYCDVTVFATKEALDSLTPTEVLKNCKVVHGYIVEKLERVVGKAIIGKVIKTVLKNGAKPFNLENVDGEAIEKVKAYLAARAEAVAAAPSFDD